MRETRGRNGNHDSWPAWPRLGREAPRRRLRDGAGDRNFTGTVAQSGWRSITFRHDSGAVTATLKSIGTDNTMGSLPLGLTGSAAAWPGNDAATGGAARTGTMTGGGTSARASATWAISRRVRRWPIPARSAPVVIRRLSVAASDIIAQRRFPLLALRGARASVTTSRHRDREEASPTGKRQRNWPKRRSTGSPRTTGQVQSSSGRRGVEAAGGQVRHVKSSGHQSRLTCSGVAAIEGAKHRRAEYGGGEV